MFTFLCAAACFAPAADPAPLPDRWLLKLLPNDLPSLPEQLYTVTWYDYHHSRSLKLWWDLWVEFRKADRSKPAEAVVTLVGGIDSVAPIPRAPSIPGRRLVPLAVHGPLIEFNKRLYTAAFRKYEGEKEMLHLGSAVELKDRVWYQAGTREDGKTVTVEEWRLEFKDDPRTAAAGAVTVRSHSRVLTEAEGKSFMAEMRFKAEPPNDRTKARIVYLVPPDEKTPRLPSLTFGDDSGKTDVIWVHGQDRLSLRPNSARQPYPPPPKLVQPPAKK